MAEDENSLRKRYKKKVAKVGKGSLNPAEAFIPGDRPGSGLQPTHKSKIDMAEAVTPKYGHERTPLTKAQVAFAGPLPRRGVTGTGKEPTGKKAPVQNRRAVKPKSVVADIGLKSAQREPVKKKSTLPDTRPNLLKKSESNLADMRAGKTFSPSSPTLPVADSPLKSLFKKNATAEGPSFPDTHGSMYIKDPVTGENIPREGYYNEAGTFIPGPRIKPHRLGDIINYAIAGVKDPAIRKVIAESIGAQGGVLDSEEGRIGSELARTGAEKLEGIKGRYLEKIASMEGGVDIETAKIGADAFVEGAAVRGRTGYTPKGYQSVTDEEGKLSVFNKDTGTYSQPGTELSPEVKAAIDRIRSNPEKIKQFYLENEALRPSIREYLSSTDSFR
jgi:hypothetical protein